MKYIIGASSLTIAATVLSASASACEPTACSNNHERLTAVLNRIAESSAAIDGVVTSGARDVGSVAIIGPGNVWFGPKQPSYRVVIESVCSDPMIQGDHVRVLLSEEKPPWSASERLKRKLFFWRYPEFRADQREFRWAMRFGATRDAVKKRLKAQAGR